MDRRTFLGASGLLATGGFAGCTGSAADTGEGVMLPRVELGNFTSRTHTFDLLVEYNGELEFWDSVDIGPTRVNDGISSDLIDPGLPDEPGEIVAQVRIGQKRASIDFLDEGYGNGECVVGIFLYGFRGSDHLSAFPTSVSEDESLATEIDCQNGD